MLAVAATLVMLVLVLSPTNGFSRWFSVQPVVAQLLAFAPALGVVGIVAALCALWALTRGRTKGRTARGRGRSRTGGRGRQPVSGLGWRGRTLVGAASAVLVLSLFLVLLPAGQLPGGAKDNPSSGRRLRVVEWNTEHHLDASRLGSLITQTRADVLVLPETSREQVTQSLANLAGGGDGFTSFTSSDNTVPTSVIVRTSLEYRAEAGPDTTLGSLRLVPKGSELPVINAVHAAPPLPTLMGKWRSDLTVIRAAVLGSDSNTLTIGDCNATLRHGPLTALVSSDAFFEVEQDHAGTWPTPTPNWFAAPIDHVFTSGRWLATSAEVLSTTGSDHRAIFTVLALPNGA